MRAIGIPIKLTLPFPFDRPDRNGVVYSQYAVQNAINSLSKNLPITFRGNDNADADVIGCTVGDTHIVRWDGDSQTCFVTIDGMIYAGGTECTVKQIKNKTIYDFEIVGIGLSNIADNEVSKN